MKNKLLIISSGYPNLDLSYLSHTFLKGYVDEAKHFYKSVKVVVLTPYFPLQNLYRKQPCLVDYSYDNVDVFYRKYIYLPIFPITYFKGYLSFAFNFNFVKNLIDNDFIIHANFSSPAGVFADLLSKKLKTEFTLTVHEDFLWLNKEISSNNYFLNQTWKNAKTIIRVNKFDSHKLRVFNSNVITIPNGFNHRVFKRLDKQQCRAKLNLNIDKKIIVNIGFYNDQKNQKLLIDSIFQLPEVLKSNLKCLIIGGGPKESDLKKQVLELNLNNIVSVIGQIKHDDLPLFLNSADIFCLSSNSEGNPTVMFEALSAGLPYVGTNVGGVPEIITNTDLGLLSDPNDVIKLSKNIEISLTKDWDNNLIEKYSLQFSWKNIFMTTKKIY